MSRRVVRKRPDCDAPFLRALTEYYRGDYLAPGLVIAWLEDRQCYYGSVCRYPNGASSKEIIVKAYEASIDAVISRLASEWAAKIGQGPAVQEFLRSHAPARRSREEAIERGACAG